MSECEQQRPARAPAASVDVERGRALRATRLRLGLSIRQLARLLGVHHTTVYHWERGEQRVEHPEMLERALRDIEREQGGTTP